MAICVTAHVLDVRRRGEDPDLARSVGGNCSPGVMRYFLARLVYKKKSQVASVSAAFRFDLSTLPGSGCCTRSCRRRRRRKIGRGGFAISLSPLPPSLSYRRLKPKVKTQFAGLRPLCNFGLRKRIQRMRTAAEL